MNKRFDKHRINIIVDVRLRSFLRLLDKNTAVDMLHDMVEHPKDSKLSQTLFDNMIPFDMTSDQKQRHWTWLAGVITNHAVSAMKNLIL